MSAGSRFTNVSDFFRFGGDTKNGAKVIGKRYLPHYHNCPLITHISATCTGMKVILACLSSYQKAKGNCFDVWDLDECLVKCNKSIAGAERMTKALVLLKSIFQAGSTIQAGNF